MLKQILKLLVWLFGTSVFLTALVIWYFSPILITPPALTGPYKVGYTDRRCTDKSRQEPHVSTPKDRSVLVRFYYPTSPDFSATSYPYPDLSTLTTFFEQKLKQEYKIPKQLTRQILKGLSCQAQQNAPISKQQPWPIVLFSHGIGSDCVMTSTYLEELASHGYCVAAVFHPYDTGLVKFPDGAIITVDPIFAKHIKTLNRPEIYAYRDKAHWLWLDDLNFVTSYIISENANPHSFLHQALDTKNIGIMGHSHGGAVAIDFCKTNPACKAGIDMDGWTKTANTAEGFSKPFMFLLSQAGNDIAIEPLYQNMKKYAEKFIIPGAGHSAFSDEILLKQPIPWLTGVATKNPLHIRQISNNYIKSFFDKHLKKNKEII